MFGQSTFVSLHLFPSSCKSVSDPLEIKLCKWGGGVDIKINLEDNSAFDKGPNFPDLYDHVHSNIHQSAHMHAEDCQKLWILQCHEDWGWVKSNCCREGKISLPIQNTPPELMRPGQDQILLMPNISVIT